MRALRTSLVALSYAFALLAASACGGVSEDSDRFALQNSAGDDLDMSRGTTQNNSSPVDFGLPPRDLGAADMATPPVDMQQPDMARPPVDDMGSRDMAAPAMDMAQPDMAQPDMARPSAECTCARGCVPIPQAPCVPTTRSVPRPIRSAARTWMAPPLARTLVPGGLVGYADQTRRTARTMSPAVTSLVLATSASKSAPFRRPRGDELGLQGRAPYKDTHPIGRLCRPTIQTLSSEPEAA